MSGEPISVKVEDIMEIQEKADEAVEVASLANNTVRETQPAAGVIAP